MILDAQRPPARRRMWLLASLAAAAVAVAALAATVQASSSAAAAAPANTEEPSVSGTNVVGQTLTATTGTWSGTVTTFAFQWLRCPESGGSPDGTGCTAISGSTSSTRTLTATDVGFRLRVRVTATNADGSTPAASNATNVVTATPPAVVPANTALPAITGNARESQYLHASTGTWTGTAPLQYTYRWLTCDAAGANCAEIPGAADNDYYVRDTDVGKTVRVRVTATNPAGSANATAAQTAVVVGKTPTTPEGIVTLPGGDRSIPVTSVTGAERLIVDQVQFTPRPVTSRTTPITVRIRVKDTRGYVVRGATVFVRSTPKVTSGGDGQQTGQDGWITYTLTPEVDFPQLRRGYSQQFFVRAYLPGTNPLAGINGYRLVQVPLSPS